MKRPSEKPCKRGHTGPRYGNRACVECARVAAANRRAADPEGTRAVVAEWRKANSERVRAARAARYAANREEILAKGRKWRAENKDKAQSNYRRRKGAYRNRRLVKEYGITSDQFSAMRDAQNGACAICEEKFSKVPHIDHCHATGKVRSLLCGGCNMGLGRFKDDPCRLEAAASYLRQHAKKRLLLAEVEQDIAS